MKTSINEDKQKSRWQRKNWKCRPEDFHVTAWGFLIQPKWTVLQFIEFDIHSRKRSHIVVIAIESHSSCYDSSPSDYLLLDLGNKRDNLSLIYTVRILSPRDIFAEGLSQLYIPIRSHSPLISDVNYAVLKAGGEMNVINVIHCFLFGHPPNLENLSMTMAF